MMTRGGDHSEIEIPQSVRLARERHPHPSIHYLWPYDPAAVAYFLAEQVERMVRVPS